MPSFCNGNVIATLQPPLLTDLIFLVIMELAEDRGIFTFSGAVISKLGDVFRNVKVGLSISHNGNRAHGAPFSSCVFCFLPFYFSTFHCRDRLLFPRNGYGDTEYVEGFSETWRRRRKRQRRDARRAGSGSRGTRRKKARMARDLLVKITTKIVRRSYNL